MDPDLIRTILLELEALPASADPIRGQNWLTMTYDDRSKEDISDHIRLMGEAGFIETYKVPSHYGTFWHPVRMTYKGHEYLNSVRSDTVWNKSKELAGKAFGTVTIEGIKAVLPYAIKAVLQGAGMQ
ncbi:MAG: DUF2513 domain-containing protein [Bryobacteraceae bacterium]|nr:DUF2513 domain-containing protein [Bryobacteraceae bacterium]